MQHGVSIGVVYIIFFRPLTGLCHTNAYIVRMATENVFVGPPVFFFGLVF